MGPLHQRGCLAIQLAYSAGSGASGGLSCRPRGVPPAPLKPQRHLLGTGGQRVSRLPSPARLAQGQRPLPDAIEAIACEGKTMTPLSDDWAENLDRFIVDSLQNGCAWGLEGPERSEEHTSELQSRGHLVCRLLLE